MGGVPTTSHTVELAYAADTPRHQNRTACVTNPKCKRQSVMLTDSLVPLKGGYVDRLLIIKPNTV